MLITKFNKMIRNRMLWMFFAIIVTIAFVGSFSPGGGGGCSAKPESGGAGMLYGENISAQEFYDARFFTLLSMGLRDTRGLSDEANNIIRARAWRRLAALKTAEKLEISTLNEEIADLIRRDPAFQIGGVFDKNAYRSVINSQMRIRILDYEEFLRQERTLQKLADMLRSIAWSAPTDLEYRLKNLTDTFVVDYAKLTINDYTNDVEVTNKDIEDFFNENKERFAAPEKINVRYVAFPISNYMPETAIEDSEIYTYYTNHLEEYSTIDTNNEILSLSPEDVPEDVPENVREDIVKTLRHKKAAVDAEEAAMKFVDILLPDRHGNAPTMRKLADEHGLAIATSEFFSAFEDVPDLKVDYKFNEAAFALEPPERYFSDDVLVGEDAVYVIAANDRRESYVPELSEVIDKVTSIVRQMEEQKVFLEKFDEIKGSVEDSIQSGNTFQEALKDFNLNVSTSITFNVYDASDDEVIWDEIEHFSSIVPVVMTLNKGEIADIIEVEDGILLAYVADRRPGEQMLINSAKVRLRSMLTRYQSKILVEEWKDHMLAKADFQDLTRKSREDTRQTNEPAKDSE